MHNPQTGEPREVMLARVIRALCHRPELLQVNFSSNDGADLVQIIAHPNDAKIIVGRAATHLQALAKLARLLWHGSGRLVQIMPVESTEHKELRDVPFKARADWGRRELAELLIDLAQQVFPAAKIDFNSEDVNDITTKFTVSITPPQHERSFRSFGGAIAVLWLPMATKMGHYIYAGTGGKNGHANDPAR